MGHRTDYLYLHSAPDLGGEELLVPEQDGCVPLSAPFVTASAVNRSHERDVHLFTDEACAGAPAVVVPRKTKLDAFGPVTVAALRFA
ncbi:hypothetical protein BTM25_01020 [Actinomadura rubteroloni]|uniref:Uncharacterized protein n=1 Tax=Actinomadura rubteroloni TaxID=1926885 RepID=A0A2P4UL51_9ACTN|nr:hypothetical protein [Actinomadura rubteroloni]POM25719.1 hypothetical protein BTM25_01020 [Actinomadura rubteroloni]